MAAGLILRFPGAGRALYDAVNAKLGIDMSTGSGEWPDGLLSHAAGEGDGGFYVVEVWESREAQGRFMNGRLGRAFAESGVEIPQPEITWFDAISYHTPGKVTA